MFLFIVFLIVGLVVLVKGADFLVSGASSLAKRYNISEIAIGLTIVAFGTSAPEMVVNIVSSMKGSSDLVFGNVVGSNIFNVLLILGVAGVIYPLNVKKNTVNKEIPFSFIGAAILLLLVNDTFVGGAPFNLLSRTDGIILLIFFSIFTIYVLQMGKTESPEGYEVNLLPVWKTYLFIIGGLVGLVVGGNIVVENAVKIAKALHVSEKMIALTILAAGTSLPELATSAVAACKRECDIAVGNIIGSNIFNIFFILGISSIIRPALYDSVFNVDLVVLLFGTGVLMLTMFVGKKHKLDRWESIMLLLVFICYMVFLFLRG